MKDDYSNPRDYQIVTEDKLFLLSSSDIAKPSLGFYPLKYWGDEKTKEFYVNDIGERKYVRVDDYALLRKNTDFSGGGVTQKMDTATGATKTSVINTMDWWLRDVDEGDGLTASQFGSTTSSHSSNMYVGVCPALHLDLSNTDVWSKTKSITCKPGEFGDTTRKKIEVPQKVGKIKGLKIKKKKNELLISWKPVKGVDKYIVEYCFSKDHGYKVIKQKRLSATKKSYTTPIFKKNLTYLICVAGVKKERITHYADKKFVIKNGKILTVANEKLYFLNNK